METVKKFFSLPHLTITSILLLAAVLLYAIIFNKPTNDQVTTDNQTQQSSPSAKPSSGWQTYTDPAYGYSFKYPASWKVNRDRSGNELGDRIVELNNTSGTKRFASFSINPIKVCGDTLVGPRTVTIGSVETATNSQVCAGEFHEFRTVTADGQAIYLQLWYWAGQDDQIDQLAKSITGLTPENQ